MQNIGLISDFRGFQDETSVNCVRFTFSGSFLWRRFTSQSQGGEMENYHRQHNHAVGWHRHRWAGQNRDCCRFAALATFSLPRADLPFLCCECWSTDCCRFAASTFLYPRDDTWVDMGKPRKHFSKFVSSCLDLPSKIGQSSGATVQICFTLHPICCQYLTFICQFPLLALCIS